MNNYTQTLTFSNTFMLKNSHHTLEHIYAQQTYNYKQNSTHITHITHMNTNIHNNQHEHLSHIITRLHPQFNTIQAVSISYTPSLYKYCLIMISVFSIILMTEKLNTVNKIGSFDCFKLIYTLIMLKLVCFITFLNG